MSEKNGQNGSEVPDYTVVKGMSRTGIEGIVAEYLEVKAKIETLEKRKHELSANGVKILVKAGVKSVMVNGVRTTVKDGVSAHISRTELIKLGVSEKVVEKATKRTQYSTLLATVPGEANGE